MKKVLVILLAIVFGAVGLAAQAAGGKKKVKKEKPAATAAAKEARWHGIIIRSSKDASTLTVRKGNIEKTVVYDSSTKWTKGKDAADQKEFKDGSDVIVLGKYDDKGRLTATRIDFRK